MALGTLLTAIKTVSTTEGSQLMALSVGGISACQAAIDASGKLTVCLMSYHYDYLGNEPPLDGDYTGIKMWYSEYTGTSRNPLLLFVMDDTNEDGAYSESSGDDDDGIFTNYSVGTLSWAQVRGDETTDAQFINVTNSNIDNAVYAKRFSGRGAEIRFITRSYFVFDLSGVSGTISHGNLRFYMDNTGTASSPSNRIVAVQATSLAGSVADFGNCFVADVAAVSDNATFFGANF